MSVIGSFTGAFRGGLGILCSRQHLPNLVERLLGFGEAELCLFQLLPRICHASNVLSRPLEVDTSSSVTGTT